jgi:hypothetical protein
MFEKFYNFILKFKSKNDRLLFFIMVVPQRIIIIVNSLLVATLQRNSYKTKAKHGDITDSFWYHLEQLVLVNLHGRH